MTDCETCPLRRRCLGLEEPPVKSCIDAPEIYHRWDEQNEITDRDEDQYYPEEEY